MTVQIEKKEIRHRVKSMIYEDAEDSYEGAFVVEGQHPNELQQQREWSIDSGASKQYDMVQRKSSRLSVVYRATFW